jgi:hypothetical protein
MSSNLLENIEALQQRSRSYSQLGTRISIVEMRLAEMALDGKLTEFPNVVEEMFIAALEGVQSIQTDQYPLRPGFLKRLSVIWQVAQRKKRSPELSAKLLELYGLDDGFVDLVRQKSQALAAAIQAQQSLAEISFPKDWAFHKLTLARRSILVVLANAWKEENYEEPIFWKISAVLNDLAGSSPFLISEIFSEIILEAGGKHRSKRNELNTFFVGLNDDKAGAILDNLILSQATYQSLLNEGWQPDRWEVENLPMSIGMFLDFMSREGFAQVGHVDEVIEIGLADATEIYRYRGSPFGSPDDQKKVKVTAPGWERNGELIIRSKVSEISSKGDK